MKQKDIKNLLDFINTLPETEDSLALASTVYQLAADSAALKAKKNNLTTQQNKDKKILKFTQKELDNMSDHLKKLFTVNGMIVTYRFRKGSYEARLRRDGYNIEVSGKDFETMKRRFLEKLIEVDKKRENAAFPLFSDYATDWLKVKKRTVKDTTYDYYQRHLNNTIIPRFGHLHLNEITRKSIQDFLFEYTDQGKNRTAQKMKQILTAIFDVAEEDFNLKSPMKKIILTHYEVKKGAAFTKAEEKQIIDFCIANPHYLGNSALLILLYTGMRVGELPSVTYDGTFIYCISEKTRKGYAEITRKIPVSPMMKKVMYLIDFKTAITCSRYTVRDALKRIFPGRHVHELRYTYISRAKECSVATELIMLWDGHTYDADCKSSKVDRGYTTYSDEFMLKEVEKINYDL